MGKPTSFEVSLTQYIGQWRRTRRTETSKEPQEKKSTEIPKVAASEMGPACTTKPEIQQNGMESPAIEGDSPVCEVSLAGLSVRQVGRDTWNPV